MAVAEFDFESRPCSVIGFDDGVCFQVGTVAIVVHLRLRSFRVNEKVAQAQAFKEETEGVEVVEELLWRGTENSCGQGWIYVVGRLLMRIDDLKFGDQPGISSMTKILLSA